MQLTKRTVALLCIISGGLMAVPFQAWGLPWIGFVAWIGWFVVDEYYYENRKTTRLATVFWWAYLQFVVWNALSTWWIMNASGAGAALAIFLNPLFMAATVWLAHVIKRHAGRLVGAIAFVAAWLAFEWLHLHWDLSWPWLQLGNSFAISPNMVQWFEYTGAMGGSLWILVVNILLFEAAFRWHATKTKWRGFAIAATLCVIVPVVASSLLLPSNVPTSGEEEMVVIQPNVDPYGNELEIMSSQDVVKRLLQPAEPYLTPKTKFVLLPECALPQAIWENSLPEHPLIREILAWSAQHNNVSVVTGATTALGYESEQAPTASARNVGGNRWYDLYNTALLLQANQTPQIYHKSQLVLGVEKMPLASVLPFLKPLAEMLGGSANSLGIQNERTPFVDSQTKRKFAPVICYESVYGAFLGNYSKHGSEAIFLITNDGWWGNTLGHKQHLSFSSLRAIENRRTVVRSASTGISAMILPNGEIVSPTEYGVAAVCSFKVPLYNNPPTFYARWGDWLGALACATLGFIALFLVWKNIKKRSSSIL